MEMELETKPMGRTMNILDEAETDAGTPAERCILIVDDNQDAADSLSALLGLMGNEVHVAYDGLQALEMAAALEPDIILMDIGLPKLNGYDAARQMRAIEALRGVTLVALTGWGQGEDRRRSQEAGFDHHLVKPVGLDDLQAVLAAPARRAV
jgi:CheY-like chemotaxis protein